MKVVVFCGGLGLRIREVDPLLPKPMIPIGPRPILWHIMKYYSLFGCNEFVLCLGYRGEAIKEYFLGYNEALSNDFVLRNGGRDVELITRDAHDWSITFVNTGLNATIGERLEAVREHVEGEVFLATYGDGLTDAPMNEMVETLEASDRSALFMCVRPSAQFHIVSFDDGAISGIKAAADAGLWLNGGFFVFRPDVFDYLQKGEDLIPDALNRMIAKERVLPYFYEGFWAPMDTLKDKQMLDGLYDDGEPPWYHPRGGDGAST